MYNEEGHIEACLQAIARQTVRPYEVIVVDNNSSDSTAAIAAGFPFVTLLRESQQGVVHARNTGFQAAGGEILGRLDADTILPPDWVETVAGMFRSRPALAAVSGSIDYADIACRQFINRTDMVLRSWLARRMHAATFLLGANMAIRRSSWRQVSSKVCAQGGLHEDLDLSAHLAERGLEVTFASQLQVQISGRRADTGLIDFAAYLQRSPRTYAYHGLREHLYMYPVIGIVFVSYLFLRVLYRGYDPHLQRFRWRKVFMSQLAQRPNPAI